MLFILRMNLQDLHRIVVYNYHVRVLTEKSWSGRFILYILGTQETDDIFPKHKSAPGPGKLKNCQKFLLVLSPASCSAFISPVQLCLPCPAPAT